MTGNNIHGRPEQEAEKSHLKPTEHPPAGTAITDKAENAVQQRQETLLAAKAFRFTKGDNPFTIDKGDGSTVKDRRPLGTGLNIEKVVAGLVAIPPDIASSPAGRAEAPQPVSQDQFIAQLHYDQTSENSTYGNRPKDYPESIEPARGSKPFVDTGKLLDADNSSSWTIPTHENYKGWMPGDPINPLTWAEDSSKYIQEIMKQNFVINSDGKRVSLFDKSLPESFRKQFGNAVRHALGMGDLMFNHGMKPQDAEAGMFTHEPPGWANSVLKSGLALSWKPFKEEMADSDIDIKNNTYAARHAQKFQDFDSFARQMLSDGLKAAKHGSGVIGQ
jgi:hypothetical protein